MVRKKLLKSANSQNYWLSNKNKISQGHVEFMISFVLFITAILLLFVFLNPIGKTESKSKIQENARDIIIENVSAIVGNLDITSIQQPYCYTFDLNIYGDNFYETYTTNGATKPNDLIYYYLIYFSPYVIKNREEYHYEDSGCQEDKFQIGAYFKQKLIIKNKTLNLKKNYETDYFKTKKDLGISNDFSFSFKYKNGSIAEDLSVDRNTSSNVEKFATDSPVLVIDDHANIIEMIMNIKLW